MLAYHLVDEAVPLLISWGQNLMTNSAAGGTHHFDEKDEGTIRHGRGDN
jgi:hypothetical protein